MQLRCSFKVPPETVVTTTMTRGMVEVVTIRGIDVKIGDIVQARPEELLGWFVVAKVASLPSGMITITDAEDVNGFLVEPLGLVGLQVLAPLVGASHPPAPGSGPTSASEQYGEEQDAAAAKAAVEEAEQAAEAAAKPQAEVAPASGLFG